MPRLDHDAAKTSRLMGLSKPLPNKNVERMKRMPIREKMEVTRSVTVKALLWPAVNSIAILSGLLYQLDRVEASMQRLSASIASRGVGNIRRKPSNCVQQAFIRLNVEGKAVLKYCKEHDCN